jgi:hypothetical protein
VLVASSVVKAKNPKKILTEFSNFIRGKIKINNYEVEG